MCPQHFNQCPGLFVFDMVHVRTENQRHGLPLRNAEELPMTECLNRKEKKKKITITINQ